MLLLLLLLLALPSSSTHAGGNIWGFGQAGFVVSRGLLDSISEEDFSACEHCDTDRFECNGGGDVRIGECIWAFAANGRGIAPTRPLADGVGNLEHAASRVLLGEACDEACKRTLLETVTVDLSHATEQSYEHFARDVYGMYVQAKGQMEN